MYKGDKALHYNSIIWIERGVECANDQSNPKAVNKYMRNNYNRFSLIMPKGKKEEYKAHAAKLGLSLNAFITKAIEDSIQKTLLVD